jgi:hypothetical protein
MCIVKIPAGAAASEHEILRLRSCRAARATYSAQDDKFEVYFKTQRPSAQARS